MVGPHADGTGTHRRLALLDQFGVDACKAIVDDGPGSLVGRRADRDGVHRKADVTTGLLAGRADAFDHRGDAFWRTAVQEHPVGMPRRQSDGVVALAALKDGERRGWPRLHGEVIAGVVLAGVVKVGGLPRTSQDVDELGRALVARPVVLACRCRTCRTLACSSHW